MSIFSRHFFRIKSHLYTLQRQNLVSKTESRSHTFHSSTILLAEKQEYKAAPPEEIKNAVSANAPLTSHFLSDHQAEIPEKDENIEISMKSSNPSDQKKEKSLETNGNLTSVVLEDAKTHFLSGIHKPYKAHMQFNGMKFDSHGNCTLVREELRKTDLCKQFSLQPRDLRKLDTSMDSIQLPSILVRETTILISLGHSKALIQVDAMILLSNGTDDPSFQSALIHELQGKLGMKDLPFELQAMEAVIFNAISNLETERDILLPKIKKFLVNLNDYVNQEKLKNLLVYRRELDTFERKVEGIRKAIYEILNNDEDLAGLYISDKKKGNIRHVSQHMEAELLLEHYSKLVDEIYNQVNSVKTDITATEAITHIVLDKQRNNLILFDLKANLASVSIASGTFVTSIFGMNLMSQLEQIPGLFYIACGSTAIITALVYRATMKLLAMIRPGRLTTAEEIQKLFKR